MLLSLGRRHRQHQHRIQADLRLLEALQQGASQRVRGLAVQFSQSCRSKPKFRFQEHLFWLGRDVVVQVKYHSGGRREIGRCRLVGCELGCEYDIVVEVKPTEPVDLLRRPGASTGCRGGLSAALAAPQIQPSTGRAWLPAPCILSAYYSLSVPWLAEPALRPETNSSAWCCI